MKILVCYTRFPWPLHKGDSLTVFKLLEFLAARHHVDLLTIEPPERAFLRSLPDQLASVTLVRNPRASQAARLARAIASRRSLQIDAFFNRDFATARARLLQSRRYDIVYSHYIRSFGHDDFDSNGARKVIGLQLSHQAHFAKAARKARNPVIRRLYAIETGRLEHWEARIAGFNDLIHLISPRDLEAIRHHESWSSRVFFNPHGVDPDVFTPDANARVHGRVIFTGNLGFQANEDAVLWLVREIWPRIIPQFPAAQLLVAGARPTAKVRDAVMSAPHATLRAFPPRMHEVIQTGDVAVDPLRIGAGLQNKILEAMACGLPVVATPLANEGIGAEDGHEIVLADTPNAFAASVVDLLRDRERNHELGTRARAFIERAWSWDHHFEQLEQRWIELCNRVLSPA